MDSTVGPKKTDDIESRRSEMLYDSGEKDVELDDFRADASLLEKSPEKPKDSGRTQFILWTVVNTLATIAIVFTNKHIFDDPHFRNLQTSFACFHFLCTSLTLFVISQPSISMFTPRPVTTLQILPLATAMCLNVVLPNASLAYSTVTFYQIARILLTPIVAAINFFFYSIAIPQRAALALIPVCLGVGTVSYYDTLPQGDSSKVTTVTGVIFAFAGVAASSVYTVWIGSYHRKWEMSSMQLLFNQAPVSSMLLLICAPFIDTFPVWSEIEGKKWGMVLLSGVFASLINLSQFFIVNGAGAVSSTVVGHAKTCSIVALGWYVSQRSVGDKSLFGIVLAIGGIVLYSWIMLKTGKKA